MNEERKKLIDNLEAWRDCWNTKCEDCRFSDPIAGKRKCTAMDEKDMIDLALKVVKNDEVLLKNQKPVEPEIEVLNEVERLHRCPRCHKCFFYAKQKFCDQCGQAVKWNDL